MTWAMGFGSGGGGGACDIVTIVVFFRQYARGCHVFMARICLTKLDSISVVVHVAIDFCSF